MGGENLKYRKYTGSELKGHVKRMKRSRFYVPGKGSSIMRRKDDADD
jgi:hypothetical protein